MIRFGGIQTNLVGEVWDKCKVFMNAFLKDKTNPYNEADYRNYINDNIMQLWVAADDNEIIGIAITSIDRGSNASICMVHCVGGKHMKKWASLFDEALTEFAISNQCVAIKASARRGFKKLLPNLIEDSVIYTRILSNNVTA